jgi:hypothetical protein
MTGPDSPATMCAAFQATAARYPQEVALRIGGRALTIIRDSTPGGCARSR